MSILNRSLWFILTLLVVVGHCRVVRQTKNDELTQNVSNVADAAEATQEGKQIFLGGGGLETSMPNFVRLVVMRLLYGLASSMGIEDRLQSAFNGVLVPPNADESIFNLGNIFSGSAGGGEEDEVLGGLGGLGDIGDIGDIFDI